MGQPKLQIQDLACLGGAALFAEALHVGKPQTPDVAGILTEIGGVFESGILTNQGPRVQAFEAAICEYLGVGHCISTCNGTLALLLLLKSLALEGEVIVPAFTFPATVQVLSWLGLRPVFCDIDVSSHSLSPAAVADCISPRTSAILGVHLWGAPCAIEELQALADRHRLRLVFDAAHALGCSYQGRKVGNFGDAEILSFHATKFVHSLEGGAVVTHSATLARQLRLLRNFGYENGVVQLAGINAKMNEVSAVVGLHNLAAVDQLMAANRLRYAAYQQGLAEIPGLQLYALPGSETQNHQYVVLEVLPEFGLSRNALEQILRSEGVLARAYFDPPCHHQPPYVDQPERVHLPITEALAQRVLVLPTGIQLDVLQIQHICQFMHFCHQFALQIQMALDLSEKLETG